MNQRQALWGVDYNRQTGLWDVVKFVKSEKVVMDSDFSSCDEAITRRGEMQAEEQGVPFNGVGPAWNEEMVQRGMAMMETKFKGQK